MPASSSPLPTPFRRSKTFLPANDMLASMRRGFLSAKKKRVIANEINETETGTSSLSGPPMSHLNRDAPPDFQIIDFRYDGVHCEPQFMLHPPTKQDYPDNALITTRLPNTPNCGPSTELIVHAHVKTFILNTPGFPSPLPTRIKPLAYEIKHAGTAMGLGMYATRDLAIGDLILVERPFLVFPENVDLEGVPDCRSETLLAGNSMLEGLLQLAFSRMEEENKKAFIGLANCHGRNRKYELVGTCRTNSFGFSALDHHNERIEYTYSCNMNEMSRLNHSCTPNVAHSFDLPTFAFYLRAGKPIAKGEQMFYSYHGSCDNSISERKEFLQQYFIDCTCHICSLEPNELEACDSFRASIPSRVDELEIKIYPILAPGSEKLSEGQEKTIAIPLLEEVISFLREMERWKMEANFFYMRALFVAATICGKLRTSDRKYVRMGANAYWKAERLLLALEGKHDHDGEVKSF